MTSMGRKATAADVARLANVSVATVSRHMTGRGYVAAETREVIDRAAHLLEYVPNHAAASLTTRRAGLLGFVFSDLRNAFTAELAAAMQDEAEQHGSSVLLSHTRGDAGRAAAAVRSLRAHGVDGLAVTPPSSEELRSELASCVRAGVPVVGVGLHIEGAGIGLITADSRAGALAAVAHLVTLGHRRIAFVGPALAGGRYEGYRTALSDGGIEVDPSMGLIVEDALSVPARLSPMLRSKRRPTALFAFNDDIAVAAYQVCGAHGLRIPDDLSVVGFDDIAISARLHPPLTTVAQPIAQMGHLAVSLLLDPTGEHGRDGQRLVLDTSLVVRESSAPPGGSPRPR